MQPSRDDPGYAGSLCNKNVILSGTIKAITVDARFVTMFVESIHLCVCNSLPLVPILRQTNPVDTLPFYYLTVHSDFIFPSMTRHCKTSDSFGLSCSFFVCISLLQEVPYFPAHKTHRDFFVRNFRKK